MSSEAKSIALLSKADLELDGEEPRVSHHVLAERLEVRPDSFKRTIDRLSAEDDEFGELRVRVELSGTTKQRRTHALLTEEQATKAIILSHSKRAIAMRNAVVKVFLAVKNAEQNQAPLALASKFSQAADVAHSILLRAGVRDGIAAAAMLAVVERHTGVAMEAARLALPADAVPSERLNPTKLGAELGITAREVNARLLLAGLQAKGERDAWMLTEAGKKYGEAVPFANGKHAGNQLLWSRDVLEALK